MEARIPLLCVAVLVLIMAQLSVQQAAILDANCESTGKVSYRVDNANGYYLGSTLCSKKIKIVTNAKEWYSIDSANCDYTLNVAFTVQLTLNKNGIYSSATDVRETYVCSAQGLPPQKINYEFTGLTQTTGPPIVLPVEPGIEVYMFLEDCMTPVTTAVEAGTKLCLIVRIEDAYNDAMSMQIQTIRVKSPDSGWYTLTGGDGMPGCATYDYFQTDIWPQLEQHPDPANQRVLFSAFLITDSTAPETQRYEITVLICEHPSYAQCDTNYQGCLPIVARRKRDLHAQLGPRVRPKRDVSDTTELQLSTSVVVNPGDTTGTILSNRGSNSDTNTVNNAGNLPDHSGNDVKAEQQTGSEPCEVCMKRSVLYGLIGFFIPALILAFGASACLWWRTRNQIRKVEETEIICSRPMSMPGSSFRNSAYTH